MVTIERNREAEAHVMARLRARERLEGRHLTDGIYCNVKAWGFARLEAVGQPAQHDDGSLIRFLTAQGMAAILEEQGVSQVPTISADDDSVGTIDLWTGKHAVEIKVTQQSSRRDVGENDHWLTQIGGYTARNLAEGRQSGFGQLWSIHLSGDHGKKFCPEHGIPDEEFKLKHPDTGRPRLACPECLEFLVEGDREPCLRIHDVRWTREELESLHVILTDRLATLKDDIENADYGFGSPPPIRWGYEFECPRCTVREKIGCPGREATDELEAELKGSITALEGAKT